jgi:GAF domain-containing protein
LLRIELNATRIFMTADKGNASGAKPAAAEAMNDLRLGAARKRLAESNGQEDAIEGLREIVANFLGSEEMGLFRVDRRTATFQVFWSFGIDLEEYDLLRALGDAGLQRVMRGECHVEFERSGGLAKAQAFVPISVADQTIAVLAILRLLPQKVAFDKSDMELFKLLSDEAAKPLFGPTGQAVRGIDGSGMRA